MRSPTIKEPLKVVFKPTLRLLFNKTSPVLVSVSVLIPDVTNTPFDNVDIPPTVNFPPTKASPELAKISVYTPLVTERPLKSVVAPLTPRTPSKLVDDPLDTVKSPPTKTVLTVVKVSV